MKKQNMLKWVRNGKLVEFGISVALVDKFSRSEHSTFISFGAIGFLFAGICKVKTAVEGVIRNLSNAKPLSNQHMLQHAKFQCYIENVGCKTSTMKTNRHKVQHDATTLVLPDDDNRPSRAFQSSKSLHLLHPLHFISKPFRCPSKTRIFFPHLWVAT